MHGLTQTAAPVPQLFLTTGNNFAAATPEERKKTDVELHTIMSANWRFNGFAAHGKCLKVRVINRMSATEEFREMSPQRRRCYFPHETKVLRHFETYSESNCLVECGWREAAAVCRCVPWFLVGTTMDSEAFGVCELYGNVCFNHVSSSKVSSDCKGNCLPDCERTTYSARYEVS
jgi:hypothetical protein